jgi:hypothetical protein
MFGLRIDENLGARIWRLNVVRRIFVVKLLLFNLKRRVAASAFIHRKISFVSHQLNLLKNPAVLIGETPP